jgi:hypothetical protein
MEDQAVIIDGFRNPESLVVKLKHSKTPIPKELRDAANKQRMLRYNEYKSRIKEPFYFCVANDIVRLEEKVLEHIALGYEPLGNVCFDGRNYIQSVYYHKQGRRGAKAMRTSSLSES